MKRRPSGRKLSDKGAVDLDGYLSALPADARVALQKLRKSIGAAAPRAEEGSSYGLPAFKLDGKPLVCFAAATHHCSFYPMSAEVMRRHAVELRNYETSKGTVRFPADKPLPSTLVRKLVKARVAELQETRTPTRKIASRVKSRRRPRA